MINANHDPAAHGIGDCLCVVIRPQLRGAMNPCRSRLDASPQDIQHFRMRIVLDRGVEKIQEDRYGWATLVFEHGAISQVGSTSGKRNHDWQAANRADPLPLRPDTRPDFPGHRTGTESMARYAHPEPSPNRLILRLDLARPKRFELLTPRFVVWCPIIPARAPMVAIGSIPDRLGHSLDELSQRQRGTSLNKSFPRNHLEGPLAQ